MRKSFLSVVLALFVFYWIPAYAATLSPAAVPKVPKTVSPSSPPPVPTLNITAPNGGEKWLIGSTRNITWTTNLNGYCKVVLYRGSTGPQTRVGRIGSGTQISNKIMSWKVGSYDGGTGTAPPGNDYWIVIKSEAVAKSDASNGPFTLMAIIASPSASTPLLSTDKKELSAAPTALKLSAPPEVVKILSLTYPRRADGFHKGIQYKITWKSVNLNDAKLKLELLDTQETTVLQNIHEGFDNTGEKLWDVPMTLPDERKLYKIRIQTMDGTKSDTVPIWIAKGAAPAGSPTLKVTQPGGGGDRSIGDTIPIKWTSTTTCSANGGPLDDGFRIDLIGKTTNGVNVSMLLKNPGQDVFDNEGPTGVLNWHWDWEIQFGGSYQNGTYRIKVTNFDGKCSGMSAPFRLMYPRKWIDMPQKNTTACYHQLVCTYCNTQNSLSTRFIADLGASGAQVPPMRSLVGFFSRHMGSENDAYVVRSLVTFNNDLYWYKKIGTVKQVKLVIKRNWKQTANLSFSPCLQGIALMVTEPVCHGLRYIPGVPPSLPGAIPINTSQGDTWEVYLTQQYLAMIAQEAPDYGIMLYPSRESYSPCAGDLCVSRCAESYDLTLSVSVEANQYGSW